MINRHQFESLKSQGLNWLVILFAFAASAVIGLRGYQLIQPGGPALPGWALLLFGGLVGGFVFILSLRNMQVVLTIFLVVSVTVTFTISTGTQSPLNVSILLIALITAAWILRMLIAEKHLKLIPSTLNLPLIIFLLVMIIAWIASYAIGGLTNFLPSNALQIQAAQFAMFALSAAAFFLTANHIIQKKTLELWTWIILLLGIFAIGSDVLKIRPHPLPFVKGAMQMWPFVLLFAHLLFNPELKRKFQITGWLVIGFWAYWVYFTPTFNTKGLWVPALFAMFLLLSLRKLWLSLFLGASTIILLFTSGFFDSIFAAEAASGYRFLIWQDVLGMTSRDWLLGLGPVNYMFYWPILGADSATLQYAIQSQPWMAQQWGYFITVPSHNLFVDILAQSGVIGLSFFIVFLVLAIRFGLRLSKRFKPGFYKAHVYGVLCGFVAMAIGSFWFADWLLPFVYNITINGFRHSVYTWLLLGTLVSISYYYEVKEVE